MTQPNRLPLPGLKPKDLVGMPWRLAFALQADGWWLRSDIVWAKPNPMPESVTDRPTKAHEYIFLLTRSERYYYDAEAIRERDLGLDHPRAELDGQPSLEPTNGLMAPHKGLRTTEGRNGAGRNKRTVWTIPTEPFPDAHFATFPRALVEPCVKAGTSERGACPACGGPWRREVERTAMLVRDGLKGRVDRTDCSGTMVKPPTCRTIDWSSSCACPPAEPVPCVVLDPFAGAGTTGLVACGLGRDFVGIELNPEYAEMARRRIANGVPYATVSGSEARDLKADNGAFPLFAEGGGGRDRE